MAYFHGVYNSEIDTSLTAPIQGSAGLQVIFGTAPIHLSRDPAAAVNKPMLCYSFAECQQNVGYSDNFKDFTLCQSIDACFRVFNVAPIILVNVLDPKKASHTKENAAEDCPVADGQVVYKKPYTEFEALLPWLVSFLLPEKKCRAVMEYDPAADRIKFFQEEESGRSISRIQDISIFVEDFAEDCMSDLLTNILRLPLSQFTAELMRTYDKTPTSKHIIKSWDLHAHSWVETEQPYWTVTGQKILLVPKWWVRKNFLFKAHQYLYGVIIERMKMEPGYENLTKIDVWKNMERDFEHWEYAKVIEYTQRHPDALSDYHTRIPKYYNRSAGCMDDNDLDQAVYGRLISEIA